MVIEERLHSKWKWPPAAIIEPLALKLFFLLFISTPAVSNLLQSWKLYSVFRFLSVRYKLYWAQTSFSCKSLIEKIDEKVLLGCAQHLVFMINHSTHLTTLKMYRVFIKRPVPDKLYISNPSPLNIKLHFSLTRFQYIYIYIYEKCEKLRNKKHAYRLSLFPYLCPKFLTLL